LNKSKTEAWDFLEQLAKKTLQWETTMDEEFSARISSQKEGIHTVTDTTYIDTRLPPQKICFEGVCVVSSIDQLSPRKWSHILIINPPINC